MHFIIYYNIKYELKYKNLEFKDNVSKISIVGAGMVSTPGVTYKMFRAWYVPLYKYGILHGDPHLGNYTFSPETGVNLLDFGCISRRRPVMLPTIFVTLSPASSRCCSGLPWEI